MIKCKTDTGFSFKIDEEARDDMEVLENLSLLSAGKLEVMPKVLTSLLGEDQKNKLYEHCRGKSGRVSAKKVFKELESIFNAAANAKETSTKN